MKVWLSKDVLAEIHSHVQETYPEECCGLLICDKTKSIVMSKRMKNSHIGSKLKRYDISVLDMYEADREISRKDLDIIGIYHSHPNGQACPSDFDIKNSLPWFYYLIISVNNGIINETKLWAMEESLMLYSELGICLTQFN